ncbi:MAG: DUF362 domain-containing protein [Clostridia bacterium]|nr:DUF362 domain-containing protein [Clostridia bacterium]
MKQSKVYFTDFRSTGGITMPQKFKKLLYKAGIDKLDLNGKFVAIKIHFGEMGNLAFIRPNYAKALADVITELGGKPFLTDCNTLYPGSRKNAIEHLYTAWENGFSPLSAGCPVIIADGLKGTDEVEVKVEGGEYVKSAKIGHAIMDADVYISLSHFKGHENAGFGGAVKNTGMGCGSRAGKMEQHNSGKPQVFRDRCKGCMLCQKQCAHGAISYDQGRIAHIDVNKCVGCGRCIGGCNFDAIENINYSANFELNCKMAEYAKAVVSGRPQFHINMVQDISPNCDCHPDNDAPILPDIGMFVSNDMIALDRACADACLMQKPIEGSQLSDNMAKADFVDHHDHFRNSQPNCEWKSCLAHGEKIGLGTQNYELVVMK